ncbi:peptidyl-prolyl cis-trans isomerase D [Persephonella hydrogeniphila]|uniref:Periplasmic chaperone PpiD n=1 Tax=Persephonella hydrogeniphila TaxID=198703 RepID=A0A285N004_9AQUI|nr:peptidylprolyl isomerase [Persephonella hydrogeniphila]SNZ02762.1 peptidyl-prolyl cis-trans isomerase D [Persephonella hydrogeniphila]
MFINVGKSKWMKVILFITTFAFVGTAFVALVLYKLSGNIQGVAQVNGKDIPVAEFYYQVTLITNQMESKGIDTAPLKKQIYRDALRNVIEQELLFQEAQKEGVEATKEEVKRYLLDIEAFKENGKFSRDRYLAFLSQVNLTPSFFEEILRKELSVRHLLTLQKVGFYVSEDELNTFINKQLAKITGKFVLIKVPEYKPSEKEIKEYYTKNIKDFSGKKGKLIVVYQIDIKGLGTEKAQKKAQEIYKSLKNNTPVKTEKGVKKIFEDVVYDNKAKLSEKLLKELKNLSDKKKILLVSDEEHYYLIKYVKEVSKPLPLEKVREEIAGKIVREYKKKKEKEIYEELKGIVPQIKDLKNLAYNYKGEIKSIKGETAQSLAMEFGISQEDLGRIVRGKKGEILGPFRTTTGILIGKLEKIEAPEKERKKEMEKILKPILTENKYKTVIQMLIDKLKEESEIVINRRFLQ